MSDRKKKSYIVGIDEVGRGPLAGPVTVVAVAMPKNLRFRGLKDSKKLTVGKRQEWFRYLRGQPNVFYAAASVTPVVIDRVNIAEAANLAATRSLSRLAKNHKLETKNCKIFLDGGLYINENKSLKSEAYHPKTVIKGDEKYNCIKLASIVAKVRRDRYMTKLHKIYPGYGFNEHKGYGTKRHRQAIKKYGPSKIHRLTFIKKYIKV